MSGKAHLLVALTFGGSVLFMFQLVRSGRLRAKYSLLWLSAGVVLVILGAVPNVLDEVADWLGVGYPPSIFFLLGTVFLLMVVAHLSWELSRMEERTRTLAEEIALLRQRLDQPDDPPR